MAEATVSAGYVIALLRFAALKGASEQGLLSRAAINREDLAEPDRRVPTSTCAALMAAAIDETSDAAFALHFGENVRTEDLSLVWLVVGAARTVEEGRKEANRLSRLVRDEGLNLPLLDLARDGEGTWLEYRALASNPYFVEAGFAWCAREARAMLAAQGRKTEPFKAVHFRHDEPSYRAEYDRIFRVPLVFKANRNALLVEDTFLSAELPRSNPYVARVMRERAELLLAKLDNIATARGRVVSFLTADLQRGEVSIAEIARRMGMSRATLYRKLKQEGVSYERLLDEVRRRMALHYLTDQNASVSKTAYLLGFSDPAAFSRAFKRWTGKSPRSARNSD